MLLIRLHKPEDGNIYSLESGGCAEPLTQRASRGESHRGVERLPRAGRVDQPGPRSGDTSHSDGNQRLGGELWLKVCPRSETKMF